MIIIQLNIISTMGRGQHVTNMDTDGYVKSTSIPRSNEVQDSIFESDNIQLTNTGYYSENPKIAIDSQGKLHLSWQDGQASPVNPTDYTLTYGIYYKEFNGLNWGEDVFLSEEPTASYPVLAIDSQDQIHVIWQDSRSGDTVDLFYKTFDESGWSSNQQITEGEGILPGSGLADRPSLAIDSQNQLHVSWGDNRISMNNYEIFYKMINDGNWIADERVTNVWGKSKNPSLVVDSTDTLHLVWEDDREGNKELYYQTKSYSGQWNEAERLTDAEKDSILPIIIADSQDNLHVVWIDQRNGDWEVFYKTRTGTTWSPDQQLTKGNFARSLTATVDVFDNLHIVFYEVRSGQHALNYLIKSPVGWSTVRPIVQEQSTKMRNPSIITDLTGNLYLTWCDERDGSEKSEIYFKSGFPHLITVSVPVITPNGSNAIDITDIVALSNHPDLGELDSSEAISAYYEIYASGSTATVLVGNLTWSGQSWQALGVELPCLPNGEYTMAAFFETQDTFGASHDLIRITSQTDYEFYEGSEIIREETAFGYGIQLHKEERITYSIIGGGATSYFYLLYAADWDKWVDDPIREDEWEKVALNQGLLNQYGLQGELEGCLTIPQTTEYTFAIVNRDSIDTVLVAWGIKVYPPAQIPIESVGEFQFQGLLLLAPLIGVLVFVCQTRVKPRRTRKP